MRSAPARHDPIDELYRSLVADDGEAAVSAILKLRGETCDIDCIYSYEKRKEAPGEARIDAGQVRRLVVPARAGVFRGRRSPTSSRRRGPRASGGVPAQKPATMAVFPARAGVPPDTRGAAGLAA
ncbi:hypothetical protein ABZZ79_32200 [Streptomyces sp. NPDC006458]|uniref:hypothetical protein n=1 Tax=Streptomyces sp. NPDC006458 TaxID=3154302 RepID=UPI0033BDB5FD